MLKVLKNYQRNVFSSDPFKKFELSNPLTYDYTENCVHHKYSFVCSENFQNCWESVYGGITFS